jgi:hypothetical protein
MAWVAWGLLIGMVELLWVIVLNIIQADDQTKRKGTREPDKSVAEVARRESKAVS